MALLGVQLLSTLLVFTLVSKLLFHPSVGNVAQMLVRDLTTFWIEQRSDPSVEDNVVSAVQRRNASKLASRKKGKAGSERRDRTMEQAMKKMVTAPLEQIVQQSIKRGWVGMMFYAQFELLLGCLIAVTALHVFGSLGPVFLSPTHSPFVPGLACWPLVGTGMFAAYTALDLLLSSASDRREVSSEVRVAVIVGLVALPIASLFLSLPDAAFVTGLDAALDTLALRLLHAIPALAGRASVTSVFAVLKYSVLVASSSSAALLTFPCLRLGRGVYRHGLERAAAGPGYLLDILHTFILPWILFASFVPRLLQDLLCDPADPLLSVAAFHRLRLVLVYLLVLLRALTLRWHIATHLDHAVAYIETALAGRPDHPVTQYAASRPSYLFYTVFLAATQLLLLLAAIALPGMVLHAATLTNITGLGAGSDVMHAWDATVAAQAKDTRVMSVVTLPILASLASYALAWLSLVTVVLSAFGLVYARSITVVSASAAR